MILQNLQN